MTREPILTSAVALAITPVNPVPEVPRLSVPQHPPVTRVTPARRV